MKKTQPPVEAAEANVEEAKAAAPAEPTFTIDQLRQSARVLFGVSVSTYDGATDGLSGEFTVQDMKNHINKWLKEEY